MSRDHQFIVGDVVLDTHQDSPNPAVVLNLPPKQANEWVAYAETTVAEDNPDYPDDSPIVVVAFYDDLAEHAEELLWPESPVPLTELSDYGVKDYAFPVDRLKPADDTSLAERHAGADQATTETDTEADTTSDADEYDDSEAEPATTHEDNEGSSENNNGRQQDLPDRNRSFIYSLHKISVDPR